MLYALAAKMLPIVLYLQGMVPEFRLAIGDVIGVERGSQLPDGRLCRECTPAEPHLRRFSHPIDQNTRLPQPEGAMTCITLD